MFERIEYKKMFPYKCSFSSSFFLINSKRKYIYSSNKRIRLIGTSSSIISLSLSMITRTEFLCIYTNKVNEQLKQISQITDIPKLLFIDYNLCLLNNQSKHIHHHQFVKMSLRNR